MRPCALRSLHVVAVGVAASTTAVAAVFGGYLGTLTVAALLPRRPGLTTPASSGTDRRRIAVVVPAHDEASVITMTVEALVGQSYPADRFEVHVVADNCTDATASLARAAGAIVHERDDPDNRGKGPALNWAYERIGRPDIVAIVDADTIAEENFLVELDDAFRGGAAAVQGHYGVLHPDRSPTIALRYAALACRHHVRPLGRNRLGGSSGLYGNGMAFTRETAFSRLWSGHLVEDTEFQNDLLLDGIAVQYVPRAILRAEMPASLTGSTSQNERWELGRLQLARTYGPDLVRRAVRGGPLPRRAYLDAALDHLTPPLSVVAAVSTVATVAAAMAHALLPTRPSRLLVLASASSVAALGAHVLVSLRLDDAPPSVYRALLGAPRAMIWKIALLGRVATAPRRVSWTRTERNVSEDMS